MQLHKQIMKFSLNSQFHILLLFLLLLWLVARCILICIFFLLVNSNDLAFCKISIRLNTQTHIQAHASSNRRTYIFCIVVSNEEVNNKFYDTNKKSMFYNFHAYVHLNYIVIVDILRLNMTSASKMNPNFNDHSNSHKQIIYGCGSFSFPSHFSTFPLDKTAKRTFYFTTFRYTSFQSDWWTCLWTLTMNCTQSDGDKLELITIHELCVYFSFNRIYRCYCVGVIVCFVSSIVSIGGTIFPKHS